MHRVPRLALVVFGCVIAGWSFAFAQAPPVAASLPSAGPPPSSSGRIWQGRHAEFEEFLRAVNIERTTTIATGVLGVKRAFFTAGGLAESGVLRNIQPGRYDGFWESYKGDIAAYKLDRLLDLGMVPPTVERRYNGEMVSLQLWVPEAKMLKEVQQQNLRPSNIEEYSFQLRRQKVFQNLAGNLDPNQGNILFDAAWNVVLVDFSRAFTNTRKLVFDATSIDRGFLDRVKALDRETLRREIGDLIGGGAAIDAMLGRRDDIVKAFDRLVRQKGERQVLLQ
jgi:hypothetical protein